MTRIFLLQAEIYHLVTRSWWMREHFGRTKWLGTLVDSEGRHTMVWQCATAQERAHLVHAVREELTVEKIVHQLHLHPSMLRHAGA